MHKMHTRRRKRNNHRENDHFEGDTMPDLYCPITFVSGTPGTCTKQWGGAVCRNCPCDSLARIADELHALGDVANADGTSEAIAGGLCEVAEAIAYAKGEDC
jgi:hypothetical protein